MPSAHTVNTRRTPTRPINLPNTGSAAIFTTTIAAVNMQYVA